MKQEQHAAWHVIITGRGGAGENSAQIATHVWYSLTRGDKDFKFWREMVAISSLLSWMKSEHHGIRDNNGHTGLIETSRGGPGSYPGWMVRCDQVIIPGHRVINGAARAEQWHGGDVMKEPGLSAQSYSGDYWPGALIANTPRLMQKRANFLIFKIISHQLFDLWSTRGKLQS